MLLYYLKCGKKNRNLKSKGYKEKKRNSNAFIKMCSS